MSKYIPPHLRNQTNEVTQVTVQPSLPPPLPSRYSNKNQTNKWNNVSNNRNNQNNHNKYQPKTNNIPTQQMQSQQLQQPNRVDWSKEPTLTQKPKNNNTNAMGAWGQGIPISKVQTNDVETNNKNKIIYNLPNMRVEVIKSPEYNELFYPESIDLNNSVEQVSTLPSPTTKKSQSNCQKNANFFQHHHFDDDCDDSGCEYNDGYSDSDESWNYADELASDENYQKQCIKEWYDMECQLEHECGVTDKFFQYFKRDWFNQFYGKEFSNELVSEYDKDAFYHDAKIYFNIRKNRI